MGRRVFALAHLHDHDVIDRLAARGAEHLAGLLLGHGPRRVAWLALGQVDELGDVPRDEVVLLCPTDRPDQRALDLHQRGLAEGLGDVPEETVRIGGIELGQLRGADLRVDPLLGPAAVRGHGMRVEFQRVEPVRDALPDGVGGRRPDARFGLAVQLVELLLDVGLGLTAHGPPTAGCRAASRSSLNTRSAVACGSALASTWLFQMYPRSYPFATVTTTANRLPPSTSRGRGADHDHSDECNGLRG